MAGLGGFNPAPFKFGAASQTDLEAIQNAIAEAEGTSLAVIKGTVKWVENHATARVLWELYGATQKLANQWLPEKATDFLPRWEAILGITPSRFDDLEDRRRRVAAKLSLIGKGTTFQVVNDYLTTILGSIYQGLVFTDPMDATTYVPGGGSVPGGPTFLDGNTIDPQLSPYYSTVAYVAILLAKPDSMSEEEFYALAGRIYEDADNLFGAWVAFDWIRDGVNGAGFYLDEDNNLDGQRFD
ncbi:putative phage tail protein [Polyangium spumosum]|uniref:DUF2313 domain-containing protein n=1 Tax=Polyangium spumosum TaxID=889282 RepID=A0A6N7QBG9_9BACT|nr:putative phage tail protein [Polyangium spumosum]MRG98201.1 DUF2313 domain-containing protein [Polyangium spumosum]